MKLLFIGDIVGEPGRRAVRVLLPRLRAEHQLEFVVANGENSAGGRGITAPIAAELFELGVDVITTGDHIWDQREVVTLLEQQPRLLRPANYPAGVPGAGAIVCQKENGPRVAVLNLQGRTFMASLENPFVLAASEVARLRLETPIVLVDFHAEATSEKIAIARMLDGKVSAVIGTHTHVQTADEQVFRGGTAYLSDAGFTGPHDSVLGREIDPVIKRFLTGMPQRFGVASGRILLQGALVDIDSSTGRARSIQRISEPLP
ncbi:MAG: TIGR00282 family metallophosphoesterase [Pedosphaera sp.]|nr:TIGR00282 family metallophosphoesterase [Pedosphaera sp.]